MQHVYICNCTNRKSKWGYESRKEKEMAKKVTSKDVASKASKVLRDGRTSKNSKSCAASALSQREKRK